MIIFKTHINNGLSVFFLLIFLFITPHLVAQSLALRQSLTPRISLASCDIGTTTITLRVAVPIPQTLTQINELGELFFSGGIEEVNTVTTNNTIILPNPSPVRYFSRSCSPFFSTFNTTKIGVPTDSIIPLHIVYTGFQPETTYRMRIIHRVSLVGRGSVDIQTFSSSSATVEFTTKSIEIQESPKQPIKHDRFYTHKKTFREIIQSLPRIYQYFYPQGDISIDCQGPTRYYASSIGSSSSFAQIDSLLTLFTIMGMPIDTVWAQDNSTCDGKSNGTSELLIKLRKDDLRIRSFGFVQRYNDWANGCECRNYRMYYDFNRQVSVNQLKNNTLLILPNPTSNVASLHYTLSSPAHIQIEILDMLGRNVLLPITEEQGVGEYRKDIFLESLSSGVYAVRLTMRTSSGFQTETVRLVITR